MSVHVLSLSYGKDSLACLEACKLLGYPIDRIIHAEVWATDTIPADLPPMVEFKKKADKIINERYGLTVEHIAASTREREGERDCLTTDNSTLSDSIKSSTKNVSTDFLWCEELGATLDSKCNLSMNCEKRTYEKMFYHVPQRKNTEKQGLIKGFPGTCQAKWCVKLKVKVFSQSSIAQGADTNIVQYLGIAADEPERIERHTRPGIVLPLVDIGWDEAYCRQWCEENDLLSPIYTTAARGGCWFCHNQSVNQLRLLRKEYPELWELLLKWDWDSPVTFKPDGRTVHDYDLRFCAEDLGLVPADRKFRWKVLEDPNFYKEEQL